VGYQSVNNFKKEENDDLLAYSYNILNRWNNCYSQLLNMRGVGDVRQIKVHTTEPLVSRSSRLAVEIAIAKLKGYNSPGSDQVPEDLIKA
jgi:hypothetical protein